MTLPAVKWSQASIKDVCQLIVDCVNKTAPTVADPTAYKMIRTTNVRDGWVNLSEVKYVTEEVYEKWTRREVPRKGDVILTREAPLGEVGMLRTNDKVFLGQRLVMYRAHPEKLDNRFLLYAFQADHLQGQIKSLGSGATVEHMRVPDCEKLVLDLPPLPTQNKIASVLSAYDDLIENNTRRIEILEEIAHATYREWFVNFRFPGHEKTEMVDSEVGLVPRGWEVRRASDAIAINPRTRVPKEGEKPFVPMGSLSNNSMLIQGIEFRSGNSGSKFMNGDTLFARITPSLENGKTGYVQFLQPSQDVAFGSTEFIVLRSESLCSEYVYLMARSDSFRDNAIKSMTGASGRQRVQERCFDAFHFAHPDRATIEMFSDVVRPLFHSIQTMSEKNDNLRRTRDLLLPKLLSGEVDVEGGRISDGS